MPSTKISNSSLNEDGFLTSYQEIEEWLRDHKISNFKIFANFAVSVKGKVHLKNKKLKSLPVQFAEVSGDFYIQANQLSSLKGSPLMVGGTFWCNSNHLTSLQYGPEEVGNQYFASNNFLQSLLYCPDIVRGNMYLGNNPALGEIIQTTNFKEIRKAHEALKVIAKEKDILLSAIPQQLPNLSIIEGGEERPVPVKSRIKI